MLRCHAAICVLFVVPLCAQATPWQFVHATPITGTMAFSAGEIYRGLCAELTVLDLLADARDDRARTDAIVGLVTEGYRCAGYAAVAVAVGDDGRSLRVTEGLLCKPGRIEVSGNQAISTDDLCAALTKVEGSWQGWPTAGPPACDALTIARAESAVRLVYADAGRYGVVASCKFVAKADVVDLVVTIADEGRVARVGELRVLGEDPKDLPAVMERVKVDGNAVVTPAVMRSLEGQFEALGRYARVVLPSPAALAQREADVLEVRVQPAAFAPAMAEMPWEELAQLRAGLRTCTEHLTAGKLLEFVFPMTATLEFGGFTLLPGAITVAAGSGGIAVHVERLRRPDGTTAPADVLFGKAALFVQCGEGSCGYSEHGLRTFHFTARSSPLPDGSMDLRWGLGVSTQSDHAETPTVALRLHPVTALALLRRDLAKRQGDDIVVGFSPIELTIDRTGKVHSGRSEAGYRLSLRDETFAEAMQARRAQFTAAQTKPLGVYLTAFYGSHGDGTQGAAAPAQRDVLALLQSLGSLPPSSDAARAARFPIPVPYAPGDEIAAFAAELASLLPVDSWATTLLLSCRDLARKDRSRDAAQRIQALGEDAARGPLSLTAAATVLGYAGHVAAATTLAERAAERLQPVAAFADVRVLAVPGSLLRALLDHCGAHWRADPALRTLFADLPEGADDLAVVEKAFHRVWEAGLGDALRRLLTN